MLFQSLPALFETVPMMLMEKNAPKTPANSGLPSTTVSPDQTARSKIRSGHQRRKQSHDDCSNARLEQTMEISLVEHGQHCGHDLTRIAVQDHERRTLIEVVFITHEHHVDAEIKCCPICNKTSRGSFPEHFHGLLQYGTGVIALVVNLPVSQMVPVRRTAQLLKSMTGRLISESTLIEWVLRIHRALEEREPVATQKLLQMPVLHVDETSIRINRKNYWIHTCTSGDPGLMLVHAKRGQEAIDEINIIPRYGGTRSKGQEGEPHHPVLVHDRWASYFNYTRCDHSICLAHLQRDLQFILDAHQHRWAKRMLKLLVKTNQEVAENEILRFACNTFCPCSNNAAERFHRMSKVKQKMSGTFRSVKMAQACCRVTGCLQMMSLPGYNPLTAIELVLKGDAVRILEEKL